jgi:toxin FitB
MIVLDTNVVSELMRQKPEPQVLKWLATQLRRDLFTTSITKAEVFFGIALLPAGRRKAALGREAERMFDNDFFDRVLPFDSAAAEFYAEIVAARRRSGKPIETLDAQIAGIAMAATASVATRDLADFEGCGLTLVNPWEAT